MTCGYMCQIDGAYAVVRCSKDSGDVLAPGKDDPSSILSDCRILRKDDLQVVKGTSTPRVPDCFQRTPKKVMLPEMGQILSTAVDTQGLRSICTCFELSLWPQFLTWQQYNKTLFLPPLQDRLGEPETECETNLDFATVMYYHSGCLLLSASFIIFAPLQVGPIFEFGCGIFS